MQEADAMLVNLVLRELLCNGGICQRSPPSVMDHAMLALCEHNWRHAAESGNNSGKCCWYKLAFLIGSKADIVYIQPLRAGMCSCRFEKQVAAPLSPALG